MNTAELPQQSGTLSAEQSLRQAVECHQAGRLPEAEFLYRALLQADPMHSEANHGLGMLAIQVAQPLASLPFFKLALEANLSRGEYWLSYIDGLIQANQEDAARQMLDLGRQRGLQGEAVDALMRRLANSSSKEMEALQSLGLVGRYAEAEVLARSLTERFPQSGPAWKALGAALFRQGKDPRVALQKARVLLPSDAEVHLIVGNALRDTGALESALVCYQQALSLKPECWASLNGLGCVLRDIGQIDKARQCFEQVLVLKADDTQARCNLGALLWRQGRLDEAQICFEQVVTIDVVHVEAHYQLACLKFSRGDVVAAGEHYEQALNLALSAMAQPGEVGKIRENRMLLVNSARRLVFATSPALLRTALARAIGDPWCRPSLLTHCCCALVKLGPEIGGMVTKAATVWPERLTAFSLLGVDGLAVLASDTLLSALLVAAPVTDMAIERFLTMVRCGFLDSLAGEIGFRGEEGATLIFFSALARQCFINEYIFPLTGKEARQASVLRDALVAVLAAGRVVSAFDVVAVACYFPLHSLPGAERLLVRTWPDAVTAVLQQQVVEPMAEQLSRATIPRLTGSDSDVSVSVRQQYEENPYPRWVRTAYAIAPLGIDGILHQRFPLSGYQPLGADCRPEVLIAGCGTGQQSIEAAWRYRDASILAIDLSLSSICYAKRKSEELGLDTITYAQADIMKLGSLGRSFDIIESSGVLHHLDEPFAGWRVLLSLLRPGGVMLLGLYSEVARRDIAWGREYIARQGYGATVDGIRQCRQDLVDLGDRAKLGSTLLSPDFFSTSACRDLLFHVQEHHLKLAEIADFLQVNGLTFLGFEIEPSILHAYRWRFSNDPAATDLGQWELFENENPYLFLGMYQFWVQKTVRVK